MSNSDNLEQTLENEVKNDSKPSFFRGLMMILNFGWILFVESVKYLFWFHKTYESLIFSITNKLIQINILYVKIFQALALNNNIIDNKLNNTLLRFVDNAPWTESEIDYDILTILDKEHDIIFDQPLKPINSGMISLVFKGKRRNTGEEIVLKMKRKNIEKILNAAIEDLTIFFNWILFIPNIDKFQVIDIMTKNMDLIKHQTNFIEEVKNVQVFRKYCKHMKYVVIPEVDTEITNKYKDVIVMNFIDGKPIGKVEKEDYLDYIKLIMKFTFVTIFLYGKMHGDLHSGNILFIKDDTSEVKYKLGILDLGIIYEISCDTKMGIYDILSSVRKVPSKDMAEIILNSSIIQPLDKIKELEKEHYDVLIDILIKFVDKSINVDDSMGQFEVFQFITDLNKYIEKINNDQDRSQKKIQLKPSDDLIKVAVFFEMLHGVMLKLCGGKYLQLSNEILLELYNPTEKE
jgi:predicted unusual protein kinase regulating ubiquinone biosynthesis (AarF/ABC1/UbiB family)